MYIPSHFREDDPGLQFQFMQAHPFATLVSVVDEQPLITHLPFIISHLPDGALLLESHMARANPQWKCWSPETKVTVIFQGPHAYISPRLYTGLQNVPTWNYIAVHAKGTAKMTDGDATLGILERMIQTYDSGYLTQWSGLSPDYRNGLLKGVVGFGIQVEKMEGKFKLNQNKPMQDRQNVISHFEESEDSSAREISRYMRMFYTAEEA